MTYQRNTFYPQQANFTFTQEPVRIQVLSQPYCVNYLWPHKNSLTLVGLKQCAFLSHGTVSGVWAQLSRVSQSFSQCVSQAASHVEVLGGATPPYPLSLLLEFISWQW